MGIFFTVFNCLPLLQPFTAEIRNNIRSEFVFDQCTITRSNMAYSEINISAVFIDENVKIKHFLNENCDFVEVPYSMPLQSWNEAKLFDILPAYFMNVPDWNHVCRKLW